MKKYLYLLIACMLFVGGAVGCNGGSNDLPDEWTEPQKF